jgi:hypothetical protein
VHLRRTQKIQSIQPYEKVKAIASISRTPKKGQLSNVPGVTTNLTSHDNATGKTIVNSAVSGNWSSYDDKLMGFNIAYTTSKFTANLNEDADLVKHQALTNSKKFGLVNPNGTVCHYVDFVPGIECTMHRTQSLDYSIALEGKIDLVLDSGNIQRMRRGWIAWKQKR